MNNQKPIPDIDSIMVGPNPTLASPSSEYMLPFYQTRESLLDVEVYKNFLNNAIARFRHSRTYKNYKANLYNLGLNHCQVHSNLTSDMVDIEMHHMILTIFDIAHIITEHMINTTGYISTFDLVYLLKQEHKQNHIALVMLSKTPHQIYHNEPMFFIHPNMCIGDWKTFLDTYRYGITQNIAFKLMQYFKEAAEKDKSDDNGYLELRDEILDWSNKINQ